MKLVTVRVTLAEARQLLEYVEDRNEAGWYYGNKKAFDKRHASIRDVLIRAIDRRTDKAAPVTK